MLDQVFRFIQQTLNKEVWVLDLAFNQDACPTGQDFAPARSLVLLDINYAIVL
ncbi:hypothetical protein C789_1794 [Microcystis aeruginosa FACHB-905 = DIANCHI905]|uniref:Uncharacterized protein n=1 Tax=Microcystis aeruginosa PCC 7806SL TaxID=1903187 RepID=A0AB33BZJ6_MICA7|nr:hypothetical protein BH695_3471 [Microcystis aeruginosa PCC 7806SL]ELS48401.1 hypothetical protein C789_1794 [Microcystis aeruginosa FACHB-905 = DIANCHI905]